MHTQIPNKVFNVFPYLLLYFSTILQYLFIAIRSLNKFKFMTKAKKKNKFKYFMFGILLFYGFLLPKILYNDKKYAKNIQKLKSPE